ncbi:hypothetical protein EJ05DRAFT_504630 [Pseudovirgaria hyperparasitica]|uniref:Uncharacterized protein n=1 Tax=Pseudovirgaria hyperparasitica TaxID=470096 RepID=A0A6A6VUX6_9PEZI|nr:uncharacterized protein EJ05DRAFT_504630 [Pseudovirgaria hyperparasitica]KAF2754033.1 hypothetical protein EJ05DRAFT_504630 [Pseudovirgaria hyperparasitica]
MTTKWNFKSKDNVIDNSDLTLLFAAKPPPSTHAKFFDHERYCNQPRNAIDIDAFHLFDPITYPSTKKHVKQKQDGSTQQTPGHSFLAALSARDFKSPDEVKRALTNTTQKNMLKTQDTTLEYLVFKRSNGERVHFSPTAAAATATSSCENENPVDDAAAPRNAQTHPLRIRVRQVPLYIIRPLDGEPYIPSLLIRHPTRVADVFMGDAQTHGRLERVQSVPVYIPREIVLPPVQQGSEEASSEEDEAEEGASWPDAGSEAVGEQEDPFPAEMGEVEAEEGSVWGDGEVEEGWIRDV